MVRGTVVLPHGTGKIVRVAVFAQGEKAQEALRAGADEVGGEDLVKKIEAGWLEFDVALATPDSMGMVGRLGKILGRARPDAEPEVRHDHVRPRAGDQRGQGRPGRVQGRQGRDRPRRRSARRSFEADALVANLAALVDAINRARPAGAKGQYLKGLTIASTMGPGIRVDVPGVLAAARRLTARAARRGDRPAAPYAATVAPTTARRHNRRRRTARDSLRPRTATPSRSVTVGA